MTVYLVPRTANRHEDTKVILYAYKEVIELVMTTLASMYC